MEIPQPFLYGGARSNRFWCQIRTTTLTFTLVIALLTPDVRCTDPGVARVQLPSFEELRLHYPGYAHFGGVLHNHQLVTAIGCDSDLLLHDTSALRLSAALNKIGGPHSLGTELIRLSKFGRDSVTGRDGLQYIYHPIAYGPYLADKYGYPTVSKLHQQDALNTKKNFWGQQGLLRIITYTHRENMPKGHVALWDCNHFHQAKDWIALAAGRSLITVEFWRSPDSDCSHMPTVPTPPGHNDDASSLLARLLPGVRRTKLRHRHWEKRLLKRYYHNLR
ncbi:hypothetical protein PoB_006438700 [Plakobranchus ocellatus]|uniref:Uncharacterized protein n=1 Tax=Plakobranchus ocellatus TaxID=259542 RepID=A0AAV4D101_9GAST|nr:hypothetical protein PoB_006438700 [Plakobranchus ocellatus]